MWYCRTVKFSCNTVREKTTTNGSNEKKRSKLVKYNMDMFSWDSATALQQIMLNPC